MNRSSIKNQKGEQKKVNDELHPYDETLLEDAMDILAEATDYATHVLGYSLDEFMSFFVSSGIAKRFQKGDEAIVTGKTGVELANLIMKKMFPEIAPRKVADKVYICYDYSLEYWCGYMLALYQWEKALSFEKILSNIDVQDLANLYNPLHEASERKVLEAIDKLYEKGRKASSLQNRRLAFSMSQSDFSKQTGVSVRTIQQYENGNRSLKKASYEILEKMAIVLKCSVEDLV